MCLTCSVTNVLLMCLTSGVTNVLPMCLTCSVTNVLHVPMCLTCGVINVLLISFKCVFCGVTNTQRAFGAKMTSYRHRCDVITSH